MVSLLDGILGFVKNSKYDTLSNLARIQGRENAVFQATLKDAKNSFEAALNLVRELESVDTPKMLEEN